MKTRILVTGSSGLIGTVLVLALCEAGYDAVPLDLRGSGHSRGDIRNRHDVDRALGDCDGVVHLAAMSRVAIAELDPQACWDTNVIGTSIVLERARQKGISWVVYASSREVYGHTHRLVVDEEQRLAPINVYGRSKVAAEELVFSSGLRHAILRFSNVYGGLRDHRDRVVPSFARAALTGEPLVVNGRDHAFDFTHVEDVARGVVAVVNRLERGEVLSPTHLVSGTSTTLEQLARLTIELARSNSRVVYGPQRSFDVATFYGNSSRAERVLQWRTEVTVRHGLAQLLRLLNRKELDQRNG